jgi:transcriptional regulator GlxA family with amidase domain
VVGYIRRLRTERARHLLVNSTLPVKAVAVQVGLPDLQQFNKVIRRELGRSPREVRAHAEAGRK